MARKEIRLLVLSSSDWSKTWYVFFQSITKRKNVKTTNHAGSYGNKPMTKENSIVFTFKVANERYSGISIDQTVQSSRSRRDSPCFA